MAFEKSITDSIIAYIKQIGGQAEKVKGTAISSGKPDINACYNGRCLRIEVKTPDNKNTASKKQKLNLKRWKKSGAIVIVAYSKQSVICVLDCYINGQTGILKYDEPNGCTSKAFIPQVKEL